MHVRKIQEPKPDSMIYFEINPLLSSFVKVFFPTGSKTIKLVSKKFPINKHFTAFLTDLLGGSKGTNEKKSSHIIRGFHS